MATDDFAVSRLDSPEQVPVSVAGKATRDDVGQLAGSMGLTEDQAQAAFDEALKELAIDDPRAAAVLAAQSPAGRGERQASLFGHGGV